MRADLVGLGLAITLLSTSLAHGQVIIDVSKVTCDQFAQSKIGETGYCPASALVRQNCWLEERRISGSS
jgi:hypothetical protein